MSESFQLDDLERFEIEQAAIVPNSDDISNCSCRGMCLRDSGRSACPCKSVGHYCSSVCHANQFSGACMNQRKVLKSYSDSDNSEDNKSDNSDVSMRPVSEL
jgi:hypothetical protein